MRRYTQVGRVVYDRPKHRWKFKDVMRIGKSTGLRFFKISAVDWSAFIEDIKAIYEEKAGVSLESQEFVFGGGTFAGGGASRDFDEASGTWISPGIAFIIEG